VAAVVPVCFRASGMTIVAPLMEKWRPSVVRRVCVIRRPTMSRPGPHWAQGMSYRRMPVTKDNRAAAQACWEKALALDPLGAAQCDACLRPLSRRTVWLEGQF
jgi:hypothetical protein